MGARATMYAPSDHEERESTSDLRHAASPVAQAPPQSRARTLPQTRPQVRALPQAQARAQARAKTQAQAQARAQVQVIAPPVGSFLRVGGGQEKEEEEELIVEAQAVIRRARHQLASEQTSGDKLAVAASESSAADRNSDTIDGRPHKLGAAAHCALLTPRGEVEEEEESSWQKESSCRREKEKEKEKKEEEEVRINYNCDSEEQKKNNTGGCQSRARLKSIAGATTRGEQLEPTGHLEDGGQVAATSLQQLITTSSPTATCNNNKSPLAAAAVASNLDFGDNNNNDDDADRKRLANTNANTNSAHKKSIKTKKRPGVLDPSGSVCYHWSMVVSLAFLYNFWSLSYRFAFREIDFDTVALWFALDYSADLIYMLDVILSFRTCYLEDGVLQRDINKIGQHYRDCTRFYLDCFCLLPLDIMYLSIGFNSILRCTRLVKIYKFWSYVDRTERHTNYPNVFRTFALVHYILVIFHWNSCLFHMISKNKLLDIENLYKISENQCADVLCQYLHAFYWSTLALTTVGDLPRPRTKGEYIYVIIELCFGLFLFASVLGHVANIVTNVSTARKEFQAKLDAVKTFMRMRRVSDELQSKVIRWFDYLWSSQESADEDKSVACLPDRLKAEIAIHVHLDTLKRVDIFQNTEAGFLCELVLRLRPVLFSPGDYVCRKDEVGHEMYIVSRGILEVVTNEGQLVVATLKAGSYFGEISVLSVGAAGNRRTASVRSVGYSDLFRLNKQDLWDVLKDYPNAEARIRARAEERLHKLHGSAGASGGAGQMAPPPPPRLPRATSSTSRSGCVGQPAGATPSSGRRRHPQAAPGPPGGRGERARCVASGAWACPGAGCPAPPPPGNWWWQRASPVPRCQIFDASGEPMYDPRLHSPVPGDLWPPPPPSMGCCERPPYWGGGGATEKRTGRPRQAAQVRQQRRNRRVHCTNCSPASLGLLESPSGATEETPNHRASGDAAAAATNGANLSYHEPGGGRSNSSNGADDDTSADDEATAR